MDLDIVEGSVTRDDGDLAIAMTLAAPPMDDVIYSAMVSCGGQLWQLAYKRAAGTATIFAFDSAAAQQHEAEGEVVGSTVSVRYPAAAMGCDASAEVQFSAESTNDPCCPDPMTDYLPERGPDLLNPKKLRLP